MRLASGQPLPLQPSPRDSAQEQVWDRHGFGLNVRRVSGVLFQERPAMSAMPGWRGEVFSWIPHLAASGGGRDSVDVAGIATTVEAKCGSEAPRPGGVT